MELLLELPENLVGGLIDEAAEQGTSLEELVKQLLEEALEDETPDGD